VNRPGRILALATVTLAALYAGAPVSAFGSVAGRHSRACAHRPASAHLHHRGRACRAAGHHALAHRTRTHTEAARPSKSGAPRVARVRSRARAGVLSLRTAREASVQQALATPCVNTELTPNAGNLQLIRDAIQCLVNKQRAQHGEAPLLASAQLQAAAQSHAEDMIANDYFEHVSPSGVTPVDRMRASGYIPNEQVGYVVGENLAWGTLSLSTPQAIVAAWVASPGHLANILENQYVETGIAVVPSVPVSLAEGAAGATYAQEFGVIVH
jgi:uncharacterized protein YkwD